MLVGQTVWFASVWFGFGSEVRYNQSHISHQLLGDKRPLESTSSSVTSARTCHRGRGRFERSFVT